MKSFLFLFFFLLFNANSAFSQLSEKDLPHLGIYEGNKDTCNIRIETSDFYSTGRTNLTVHLAKRPKYPEVRILSNEMKLLKKEANGSIIIRNAIPNLSQRNVVFDEIILRRNDYEELSGYTINQIQNEKTVQTQTCNHLRLVEAL